ncbi:MULTISPECIES: glycosyltransferase family 39 protein [unclassified Ruminococcus]|uniref:ArnT family glycosyltransferase n=1 Tax=unclassified Ruminococcus TaxID=2608920 RepID=UPI00210CB997|nr:MULTISPECIES: glycosyltransferase family 39 protein [unclassified Ruminococcus]
MVNKMEKVKSNKKIDFSALNSLNVLEKIMYIAIVLMPAFVLTSLQAYVANPVYIPTSILLGIGFGVIALLLCKFLIPSALKGNEILKIIALFLPSVLLVSFAIDLRQSTPFFCISFIAIFVLMYFGFVFPIKDRGKHICAAIILIAMLFAIEYSLYVYDLFSPDSYSYYDISRTIFGNFYNVATQRQYIVDTELGISFPYLYPTLVAVVDSLTGLKIYSGTILNIVITCISCLMLYKISTKHFNNPYAGTIAAVFMVTNDPYLTEMRVTRSVPLAILSILILTYYILDLPSIKTKSCILAGVGAGCAMVCRFDALVAAGLCLIVMLIFSEKGNRIKNSAKYAGGLLIPTAPWIIFSLVNFGKPWISDNGGTMWLVTPSIPQRYYSSTYVPQTIFNNFDAWFKCLFDVKLRGILDRIGSQILPTAVLIILAVWIVVMLLRFMNCRKIGLYFSSHIKLLISTGVCVLVYLAKFCGIWVVGFADSRYHTETFVMLILFLFSVVYSISAFTKVRDTVGKKKKSKALSASVQYAESYEKTSKSWVVNITTVLVCLALIVTAGSTYLSRYTPYVMLQSLLDKPAAAAEIESVVTAKNDNPRVFFSGINEGDPFSFGAYTGIKTFGPPWSKPSDPNALIELTDNFVTPDYVVCKAENIRPDFVSRYGLIPIHTCQGNITIYEVTNKSTFASERKLFPYGERK